MTTTNRRVTCEVCKKHSSHILITHLMQDHKMQPSAYLDKYPQADLYSEIGRKKLAERFQDMPVTPRTMVQSPVNKVFAPWITTKEKINHFEEPDLTTPTVNEDYVIPVNEAKWLLLTLDCDKRNRPYIYGPSGTGKTQLVHRIAAGLNYGFMRINMDSAVSRSEMIGEWVVKGSEMEFREGILPRAMRLGYMLLVDEIDCANPHVLNVLRPVMEDVPRLVLLEKGGEVITAGQGLDPNFRIVATGNTNGTGDMTGLYGTTSIMSAADRQRFSTYIKLHYLPVAQEKEMLKRMYPNLEPIEIESFIKVATDIREENKKGKLDEGFSPRQLINWVEKYILFGAVGEAAIHCFLNSMTPEVDTAVREVIQRHFGPKAFNP